METYARHVIYKRPRAEGYQFRPHVSFATLREAVLYVDEYLAELGGDFVKVIDLEHIDMGDMLMASECADLVARIRREAVTA